ncbi:MAG: glycosyltransferase family 4 protein [Planctomycetota bacterium]
MISNSTPSRDMRIGVVASMKKGLEQFIYREICHLEDTGAKINLYPTKHGVGLYSPRDTWSVFRWSIMGLFLAQPAAFFKNPGVYWKTLMVALRHGAIAEFMLAVYFMPSMQNVDAIYCTFGDKKLFVGYFGKLLLDKPLLCTVHAYELYQNPNPGLFREAIVACDQLITISEYNRQKLKELYDYDPDKIATITYSIDLDDYCPAKKFVVLIVGFFVQRKGHDILFQAVKKLQDPEVEVWVVGGEGAESDSVDVRGLAKQHGLESQIAFLGKQSGTALRAMYHACDVFCLPCHFDEFGVGEGFPNVIIEAMACGKPVISTKHVAIPSILKQIVVDERSVDQLATAIAEVKQSESLRRELGQHNRELAEQHFAPTNVEKTVEIIRRFSAGEGMYHDPNVPTDVKATASDLVAENR